MGLGLSIRVTNVRSRGMECGMKVISVDGETVTVLCEKVDTAKLAGSKFRARAHVCIRVCIATNLRPV